MQTAQTTASVHTAASTQVSDYDYWKPGRGRPRKDGLPNKSAVRIPPITNFPVPYSPAPQLPSPYLPAPTKAQTVPEHKAIHSAMNYIAPKVNSAPARVKASKLNADVRRVRFEEVVGSAEFRRIVECWDPNSSAYRIATMYNITPQCARHWARAVCNDYARQAKENGRVHVGDAPLAPQEATQGAYVPDDDPEFADDYDDPFGLGISLGHMDAGDKDDDDEPARNPFVFSRVKGPSRNPFPYSAQKNVRRPLHLKGDVLLLPDLHVPFWSADRLWAGVRTARALGCEQIVLLGDQLDLPQISGFPGTPPATTIAEDLEMLGKIIKVMQRLGFKVHAILGNHSARLMRATGGQLTMDWLLKNVYDGVLVSEQHEFCTLVCAGRKWVLAHGSGSNPLTFGQKTCAAAGGASVAFGHWHREISTYDVSGQHQILGAGHMLCETMVPYYNFRLHAQKWTPSCGILIREAWDGRGKVLTEGSTEIVGV